MLTGYLGKGPQDHARHPYGRRKDPQKGTSQDEKRGTIESFVKPNTDQQREHKGKEHGPTHIQSQTE
jgi:hypothetical protein